ncbi:MAG: hypothetical protein V9E94_17655 [Microthrixaceae bacterium]
MSAQLVARGLAAGHGARVLFADLDLVARPWARARCGRAQRRRQVHAAAPAVGRGHPGIGHRVTHPTRTRRVGLLPQETERRPGETVAAHLARRTGVSAAQVELDAATEALARRRRRLGRPLLVGARALARPRCGRPRGAGGARRRPRWASTSGRTRRCPRCRAGRRPG